MIYQDSNPAHLSRLDTFLVPLDMERILKACEERQKSFSQMIKVEVHHSLQDQWLNEDRARFNVRLDEEHIPYVADYKSIPFEEWLVQKTWGQFFALATIKIWPQKIVKSDEEKPRPLIFSVETESVVGLEEKVQVSEPKIDLENDLSEEFSNDEQDRYTTSDGKTTSIDMVIGDMVLDTKTTPIDMIIDDKTDMEKSRSAKLFQLKAEIDEVMPGGHNNCSTHSAVENEKYFTKSKKFGENSFFGLEGNQFENFVITKSRLGLKHRWPPHLY